LRERLKGDLRRKRGSSLLFSSELWGSRRNDLDIFDINYKNVEYDDLEQ